MSVLTDKQQKKLLELKRLKLEKLRAIEKYQKENILEYFNSDIPLADGSYMRANPKQQELLDAWTDQTKKVFTYSGANRIGKTFIAVTIAFCVMAGKWLWSGERIYFPHKDPRKVRIIGQDWSKHIDKVVIAKMHELWPQSRKVHIKKDGNGFETFWRDETTRSTVEIMSNNQDSALHEGWSGDLIYYDEPPKRDVRIANARGLVDRQGRELFAMTLLKEAWIHHEVIRALNEKGKPDKTVHNIVGAIEDNVGFGITQAGVDQFAKTLTDEEKDARLRGVPSYMSGLVYPMYKRRLHLKPRFSVPLDWPVDIQIDTHPRKPHSVLFLATSHYGLKYVIHELRMHGNGTQLGEAIVKLVNWGNYRINRVQCDPLAKSDSNEERTTFNKIATVLARYDMYLETASKDKDTGILEVKKHLMSDNNEPTLFIFDDCVLTIKEIEGYMWEKTNLQDKEKAMKVDDDLMECLYRAVLLGTEYISPEDEYGDNYNSTNEGVNQTTGY